MTPLDFNVLHTSLASFAGFFNFESLVLVYAPTPTTKAQISCDAWLSVIGETIYTKQLCCHGHVLQAQRLPHPATQSNTVEHAIITAHTCCEKLIYLQWVSRQSRDQLAEPGLKVHQTSQLEMVGHSTDIRTSTTCTTSNVMVIHLCRAFVTDVHIGMYVTN